jgi:Transmembrane secretion effector
MTGVPAEVDHSEGWASPGHPLPAPRPVRKLMLDRGFFLFWSGQAISKTGNGIYQIGLTWTVYRITNSPTVMGVVLALNFLPHLALVLMGGAVSDRASRRIMVLTSDSAAAVVTAGLVIAATQHRLSVAVLMAGSLLLGVISAFYDPAYAAMNRDLLPMEDLHSGNSIVTISTNVARVLGPSVGGVAFGLGGATLLFGLDSASFAIAAAAMAFTRPTTRGGSRGDSRGPASGQVPAEDTAPEKDTMNGLFAGVKYTFRTRWLLVISVMTVVANCACLAPYRVLLPVLVKSQHGGPGELGLLGGAEVAATVVGVVIARNMRVGPRSMLSLSALAGVLAVGTIVLGLSGLTPAALIAGALLIGGGLAFNVIETTLLQTLVPVGLLSRVFSVNLAFSFALLPLGYVVSGFLARLVGAYAVLAAGGLMLLGVCACVPFLGVAAGTVRSARP